MEKIFLGSMLLILPVVAVAVVTWLKMKVKRQMECDTLLAESTEASDTPLADTVHRIDTKLLQREYRVYIYYNGNLDDYMYVDFPDNATTRIELANFNSWVLEGSTPYYWMDEGDGEGLMISRQGLTFSIELLNGSGK